MTDMPKARTFKDIEVGDEGELIESTRAVHCFDKDRLAQLRWIKESLHIYDSFQHEGSTENYLFLMNIIKEIDKEIQNG